jgi:hypothetical protein
MGSMQEGSDNLEAKPIWCVTHQAVIEEVALHFSVKIPERLDFLDHVVIVG